MIASDQISIAHFKPPKQFILVSSTIEIVSLIEFRILYLRSFIVATVEAFIPDPLIMLPSHFSVFFSFMRCPLKTKGFFSNSSRILVKFFLVKDVFSLGVKLEIVFHIQFFLLTSSPYWIRVEGISPPSP